ncbi:hypothetical protein [Hankyongella ginsenosidimutans]|uniref:hypothetical protein n=1 Tax=Hankyongella ginsenosidimutans TaxID=1763828 RepID=UPI003CCC7848
MEDERLTIEAVTGASAGAINAVVMAHGMATGVRVAHAWRWSSSGPGSASSATAPCSSAALSTACAVAGASTIRRLSRRSTS